jgi:hypothetical protein
MYVDFNAGNDTYKLRLNTRNTVMLEKAIGGNPLSIFGNGDNIPSITTMVNILHCSMQQYQHNIDLNKAYDIFDSWLADGNSAIDFLQVIIDIYKVSGIIKNTETKN